MKRELKFSEAIREALDICMGRDSSVYVIGLGAPDPKAIFGTTQGLLQKYGSNRIMDMPCAESGMTGIVLGSALVGMRPVMIHQRIDFALLSLEQVVNQAAKWHYMFGGQQSVPMVMRLIVGRGWGQGPQHSQSLQSFFAHIPGLRVVMPTTPADAKGLLIASIEDDNPVIFIENRWLHNISGFVPEGHYRTPIGKAHVMRPGRDLTIVAVSYMCLEAMRAAEILAGHGIEAEVVDLRSLRPWDEKLVFESVRKTGRLLVADASWKQAGCSAEVVARTAEECLTSLKAAPRRVGLPECPTPTSPGLSRHYYPLAGDLVAAACAMLGREKIALPLETQKHFDVPDRSFTGPF